MSRRLLAIALLLALLAGAVLIYARVGWDRMETACSESATGTVSLSWSLPDGFTCRFEDGTVRTSLAWMSPRPD